VVSRSSYPGVGFRTANEGSTPSKSEFENKLVECFILSGAIQADVAVANAYEDGAEAWKDLESVGVMKQALIEIEFLDPENPKKLMPRLRRMFSRTQLETEEVNILRGIASQLILKRQRVKK
jgi:tRNA/rRNA methyltransferase